MDVHQLIDVAKKSAGSYGAVAEKLHKHQSRISEWKKGIGRPDASDIAAMALIAELPVLETVAAVEKTLRPDLAEVWTVALSRRGKR